MKKRLLLLVVVLFTLATTISAQGLVGHGSWNLARSQFVFAQTDQHGNIDLYVGNGYDSTTDTFSSIVRCTYDPGDDHSPQFHSDGYRIAFVSTRTGRPQVHIVNSDCTGLVQITNSTLSSRRPIWGPGYNEITVALMGPEGIKYQIVDAATRIMRNFTIGCGTDGFCAGDTMMVYTTMGQPLNFRSSAIVGGGNWIADLPCGTEVMVVTGIVTTSLYNDFGWLYVRLADERTGWVVIAADGINTIQSLEDLITAGLRC